MLEWPAQNILTLGAPQPTSNTKISMLGYDDSFLWNKHSSSGGIDIIFPFIPPNKLPSTWAWVLKLENLSN